jgi:biopolymer transport protein TolR
MLLEDAMMTASDKKLYLKADQELEYGAIVDIIGVLKEAGVELIGIIADKKAEDIK